MSNKYVTNVSRFLENSFDENIDSQRVVSIPLNMQERYDYVSRTDGQPIYMGYAGRGVSESTGIWLLFKYTYDSNDQCTSKQIAYDTWDNRTTATFA